jgi:hypothetical protein
MKLKGIHFTGVAEIQEAVTDELSPKRGIFGSFSDRTKACIYGNGAYF